MSKQEEIREGIKERIGNALIAIGCGEGSCPHAEMKALEVQERCLDEILDYLHSQGVVIKIESELPYKWDEFTRKHSYRPYKEFTTYTLSNKYGKMFGYIQTYQSLTGYKCFESNDYSIYLGNAEWANSYKSVPTLEKAKGMLLELFLESKDNPDNEIPVGYIKVGPLIDGDKK